MKTMEERYREIAAGILSQPTAPFHEGAVRQEIAEQLGRLAHVSVEQDDFGNLIARYQRGAAEPTLAFAVHMDHPGYVGAPGPEREFLGGVPEEYRAKNPPVREFAGFAMWDLPEFEVREGRIYSRACDDLIGCAAVVAMFTELEQTGAEAAVYGLFTRGEEVGFVGAIQLAKSGRIPRSVTIISLETSSERGGACKMGDGVIVRVGDRSSVFDSAITARFVQLAKAADIPFQRCLMSGGSCEATAYQLFDYRCGALCVALGNYHNCGPDLAIASEFVSLADALAMTSLCVQAALADPQHDPLLELRARLELGIEKYRPFF